MNHESYGIQTRPTFTFSIEDYAKDGGEEVLTKIYCVPLSNFPLSNSRRIFRDSYNSNETHLGKKFLNATFGTIVYCGRQPINNDIYIDNKWSSSQF